MSFVTGVVLSDINPAFRDAFNRQRISQPQTLFASKMVHDNQALYWDDAATSGTGTSSTYNTNRASVSLAVSNATAGTRVRQSKRRMNYQPGKSQLVMMTGILGAGATGITKRVGIFDANNGAFFELSGTTLRVVTRTYTSGSAVDTAVAASSWNIDKLDGTGPSGVTLDITKVQIFVIDYQWLGAGVIRFGFSFAGKIQYVHQYDAANILSLVSLSTPTLPVRYEISNNGAGAAATLVHICATVISEGGTDLGGFTRVADRGTTSIQTANNASLYPLIAMRLQSGYLDTNITIRDVNVLCTSAAYYRWSLVLNPTVTGTAFAFTAITNSAIEADLAPTNGTTISAGIEIRSGYVPSAGAGTLQVPINDLVPLGAKIDNTADILVLAVQRLTGTAETFYGGVSFQETP